MVTDTMRSRGFSGLVHVGLWVLLVLALVGLGDRHAVWSEADPDPISVQKPVPVNKIEALYAATNRVARIIDPTNSSPFATLHFIPPVVPVVPPTTRKVEVTYQGYYQTTSGPKQTILRVGDAIERVPVGGVVVTNLWVAEAVFKTLTLTNSAGQTNVLIVNVKQVVEVPLK